MGETDKIIARYGVKGLYNGEYFSFTPAALKVLDRSLEMGRAFIVPEYQKRPLALGFIWEGIGQFMARNHHYRYLFGTVSISRDYTNLSRALIVSYLKAHEMDSVLVHEVKAYNPPRKADLKRSESCILPIGLTDAQGLSQLVADIEEDGKGNSRAAAPVPEAERKNPVLQRGQAFRRCAGLPDPGGHFQVSGAFHQALHGEGHVRTAAALHAAGEGRGEGGGIVPQAFFAGFRSGFSLIRLVEMPVA